MPDYTVSLTTDEDAVLGTEATAQGITKSQLVTGTAQKELVRLEKQIYNNWWASLSVAQKKTIWTANQ